MRGSAISDGLAAAKSDGRIGFEGAVLALGVLSAWGAFTGVVLADDSPEADTGGAPPAPDVPGARSGTV